MSSSDWLATAGYLIAPVGGLILAVAAFATNYRGATYWFRIGLICQFPLAVVWSALGLYLLHHQRSPEAASPRMWALAQDKSFIAGIAVGSLLLLAFSSEAPHLWRKRRQTSNQPLQPTAGRCTERLKDEL
jgi:hypothetical protein